MFNKLLRTAIIAISCVGVQIASTNLITAAEDIPGMGRRFHAYVNNRPNLDQRSYSQAVVEIDNKGVAAGSPSQLSLSNAQKDALMAGTAYLVEGFRIREGAYAGRNSGEITWQALCTTGPVIAGDTWVGAKDSEPGTWTVKGIIDKTIMVEIEGIEGLSKRAAENRARDTWEETNCIPNR